jgi:hypothetical protein
VGGAGAGRRARPRSTPFPAAPRVPARCWAGRGTGPGSAAGCGTGPASAGDGSGASERPAGRSPGGAHFGTMCPVSYGTLLAGNGPAGGARGGRRRTPYHTPRARAAPPISGERQGCRDEAAGRQSSTPSESSSPVCCASGASEIRAPCGRAARPGSRRGRPAPSRGPRAAHRRRNRASARVAGRRAAPVRFEERGDEEVGAEEVLVLYVPRARVARILEEERSHQRMPALQAARTCSTRYGISL